MAGNYVLEYSTSLTQSKFWKLTTCRCGNYYNIMKNINIFTCDCSCHTTGMSFVETILWVLHILTVTNSKLVQGVVTAKSKLEQ